MHDAVLLIFIHLSIHQHRQQETHHVTPSLLWKALMPEETLEQERLISSLLLLLIGFVVFHHLKWQKTAFNHLADTRPQSQNWNNSGSVFAHLWGFSCLATYSRGLLV